MPQATQLEGGGSGSILPFRNGETEAWSGDGPRPRPHTLVAGWNWPPAGCAHLHLYSQDPGFLPSGRQCAQIKEPKRFPPFSLVY